MAKSMVSDRRAGTVVELLATSNRNVSRWFAMSELSRAMLRTGADDPPRLALRPREAAKALGIGERLLFDLTQRGAVPHLRLGNRVILYPVDALRDWLAEQTQQKRGDA